MYIRYCSISDNERRDDETAATGRGCDGGNRRKRRLSGNRSGRFAAGNRSRSVRRGVATDRSIQRTGVRRADRSGFSASVRTHARLRTRRDAGGARRNVRIDRLPFVIAHERVNAEIRPGVDTAFPEEIDSWGITSPRSVGNAADAQLRLLAGGETGDGARPRAVTVDRVSTAQRLRGGRARLLLRPSGSCRSDSIRRAVHSRPTSPTTVRVCSRMNC